MRSNRDEIKDKVRKVIREQRTGEDGAPGTPEEGEEKEPENGGFGAFEGGFKVEIENGCVESNSQGSAEVGFRPCRPRR